MSNIALKQGLTPHQQQMVDSEMEGKRKDRTVVIVLWLFFAFFGGHRFYLGDTGYAVCLILFGWLTLGIWPLVDIVFALKRTDAVNEERERKVITEVKAFGR